jgi:lipid A 4'-phosphatase
MAQTPTNGIVPSFDRQACKIGLVGLAICMLVAIVVFAVFPQLDLQTSAYFGDHIKGFPLRSSPTWEAVRQVFIFVTNGAILLLLVCWMALQLRPSWKTNWAELCRVAGFSALSYALIPGVVVNGLIKPLWGRVRPYDIVEFGGSFGFTSPFEISGQCTKACSFVSGETSALFTCATLALLFIVPELARKWRRTAVWVIFALAAFGSALRITVGAHFLSDVVFSAIMSSALVLVFALRPSAPLRSSSSEQGSAQITQM